MTKAPKPRGRPAVYAIIEKKKLRLVDGRIVQFFRSEVKPFTNGAYIPISKDYRNNPVLVLVLEKGVKLE